MVIKTNHTICFFILIILLSGCYKEYSYEKQDDIPVQLPVDTIKPVTAEFPVCSSCIETAEPQASKWSFKSGNSLLCGRIDTAILTFERSAFTFFGPSSCSLDTGLVITVYLEDNPLNSDKFNLTIKKTAFYYYQHGAPYIFMTDPGTRFTVTIDSYIHATHVISGTFSGSAFRSDGRIAEITSGKFKTILL
ncbi:MAG: hypothetical protein ACM3H8_13270 [Sphingobacteriales bacterium]